MSRDPQDLGPLASRVPEVLRGTAAYHVPQPPQVRAKLDANELPFALPEELRVRLGGVLADVALERYPDPNARELRALLASQLGVGGDQIVFGNGSDDTIAMLVAAFAEPRAVKEHGTVGRSRPAAVLYPTPTFVYYRLAAVARGVEPIEVPLTKTFELDEDAVERAIETHRPSVVFLALPNNPTGTLWRMELAVELAARHRDIAIVPTKRTAHAADTNTAPRGAPEPRRDAHAVEGRHGHDARQLDVVAGDAAIEGAPAVQPVPPLDQYAATFFSPETGGVVGGEGRGGRRRARAARGGARPVAARRGVPERGESVAGAARCRARDADLASTRRSRAARPQLRQAGPARRVPAHHGGHAARERMARRRTSRPLRRLAVLALVAACSTGAPGPGLDIDRVVSHVDRIVAIGPRPGDSDGSRAAAGLIEDELERLGTRPTRMSVGDVDVPEIRVLGQLHREADRVSTTDPNIVVRFGPPGDALLVMAHYDTMPGRPGAIDNAAAVALLLELARSLRDTPPPRPVVLAFTANEEIGLVGAEALAARIGDHIEFAISLDLVGGDGPLTLNGASMLIGTSEMRWLADAADRAGVVLSAPPVHRVVSRAWPQAERSDHGAFTRRGVRAVHFYNRGSDGEWIDLAYHSPGDVPARVHRASLDEVGRLLRALVDSSVPAHDSDGYWLPVAVNTVVPRWTLVSTELALICIVIVTLVLSRDGLVAQIARRRDRAANLAPSGSGLLLGAACYVLAIALACVVERAFARSHPAPWLHDPLRALVAQSLVLGGLLGLATRAVARVRPWRGDQRYLALASITAAVIGSALLVVGAAELAWVWLVPAAVIALAPRLGRAGFLAVVIAALPVACVLSPWQLREAAFHRMLPLSLPLSLWVGIVGAPTVATLAWWIRRRGQTGPLGALALGLGCGLAVIVGLAFAVTSDPACSPVKFASFHLACERV